MSFVITNVGLTAAVSAASGGPAITLATFKLGTSFNYTPLATQTDIAGTTLYSGDITSVQPYDANTVDVLIQVPANAGPFSFGEVAIYNSVGDMFACHAYPQLQYKAAGISSGVGSVWGIHCLLRLVQANTVFNVTSGTAPLDSPAFTGTPTVPTPPLDNDSTRIANTEWYHNQKGTAAPAINGVAAAGASLRWSPQDHVHPTDSTRAPINSPSFTGTPLAPTPPLLDATTKIATMAALEARASMAVPAGVLLPFAMLTPPSGWLVADGSSQLRATYPALFAAIGTTYGAADGTHFNLPDCRGVALRGYDNGRGLDLGRAFGSFQDDALQNITGSIGAGSSDTVNLAAGTGAFVKNGPASAEWGADAKGTTEAGYTFDASRVVKTNPNETRMKNICVQYCIKA